MCLFTVAITLQCPQYTGTMHENNLLGPEMSVLIPEHRGVHIVQVSNVHKSMEENLGSYSNVQFIQVSRFSSVLNNRFHCNRKQGQLQVRTSD